MVLPAQAGLFAARPARTVPPAGMGLPKGDHSLNGGERRISGRNPDRIMSDPSPLRRAGRWPLPFPDLPVYMAPFRAGGGNAVRFLFPPGRTKGYLPLQWQGPSPLPQHNTGIRTGRGPNRLLKKC